MRVLFSILLLLLVGSLSAQQLPFLALQKANWNILNPAALTDAYELEESLYSINASYRKQWLNLDDAPETFLINSQFMLEDYNILTGGHIIHDRTGQLSYTGLYGNFAYQLAFDHRSEQLLIIGLNIGLLQFRANWADIAFDQVEQVNLANEQIMRMDVGLGAYYYHRDQFFIGVSVPQSLGVDGRFQSSPSTFNLRRIPHAYLIMGAYLDTDLMGKLAPSLWLKYANGAPFSFDLNVRSYLSKYFWLGLGGGLSQSIRSEIGFSLAENVGLYEGKLQFGLSVGIPLAAYRNAFGNSIELTTIYNW